MKVETYACLTAAYADEEDLKLNPLLEKNPEPPFDVCSVIASTDLIQSVSNPLVTGCVDTHCVVTYFDLETLICLCEGCGFCDVPN